jgi:hypothetical protein
MRNRQLAGAEARLHSCRREGAGFFACWMSAKRM